jgi:hypothetical protein
MKQTYDYVEFRIEGVVLASSLSALTPYDAMQS